MKDKLSVQKDKNFVDELVLGNDFYELHNLLVNINHLIKECEMYFFYYFFLILTYFFKIEKRRWRKKKKKEDDDKKTNSNRIYINILNIFFKYFIF